MEFRHFDPYMFSLSIFPGSLERLSKDDAVVELANNCLDLSQAAIQCYFGLFPKESAYFPWASAIMLSWADDYWYMSDESVETWTRKPLVAGEVERIADRLMAAGVPSDSESAPITFYCIESPDDDQPNFKTETQWLAVEVLLWADEAIEALCNAKHADAGRCLSAGFKCMLDVSCSLVPGEDRVSHNAKIAANARHRENREMRKEAIRYYEEHAAEFKGLDAAALAIAGKIVPVTFRTVHGWISAHRKSLQSARKP